MSLAIDTNVEFLQRYLRLSDDKLKSYQNMSAEEILKAEASSGNQLAIQLAQEIMTNPDFLIEIFKLANPENKIIRLGFIDTSFLFTIDKAKCFRILNTICMVPGNDGKNTDPELEKKMSAACAVAEENLIDSNLISDTYQIEHKMSGGSLKNYRGFIISEGSNIHFIASKSIFTAKILNYENYLDNLSMIGDWTTALQVGMGIYQSKIFSLSGVNLCDQDSKRIFICYLKTFVINFINYGITERDLNESTYNIIDFCILLREYRFLFSELLSLYKNNNTEEAFFDQLAPFIIQGRLKDYVSDLNKSVDSLILPLDESPYPLKIKRNGYIPILNSKVHFDEDALRELQATIM